MKIKRLASVVVMLLASCLAATAQIRYGSPTYCCGPAFTYCGAKAHQHSDAAVTYGFYGGRWLVNSDCNNGGNNFYGNTLIVSSWGGRQTTYWYDWSADPDAGPKIAVWSSGGIIEPLMVTYDPVCMMVLRVSSPSFP